jgi:hypothetical protein
MVCRFPSGAFLHVSPRLASIYLRIVDDAYAVRLLEITAELEHYSERALNLSRDEAMDIRIELLTVMDRLRTLQDRLVDRIYETRPRARRR